jgi:hypothetical protein
MPAFSKRFRHAALFNSMKDYGAIPQALHWLTIFFVALTWAVLRGEPQECIGHNPAARLAIAVRLLLLLILQAVIGAILAGTRSILAAVRKMVCWLD